MIFRDFEQKIIKDINESGMPIDAVYFVMKNIIREIEEKYIEYCKVEDVEKLKQMKKEKNIQDEDTTSIEENVEGTN